MFDPYELLAVGRDADLAAIRAAYRRLVKSVHPDAGGDPEDFRKLQLAHDILTDDERRAKYDATGATDDAVTENPDAPALGLINQMLAGILGGENDPTQSDIIAEMQAGLDKSIVEYRMRLSKLGRAMDRCRAVAKRVKRRKAGDNAITGMLDWQIRQIEPTIAAFERDIVHRERAKELLADYRFEWDRAPARPSGYVFMSQAGLSTWP